MRGIYQLFFLLLFIVVSCSGRKAHFEWIKAADVPYLKKQIIENTDISKNKEIQVTVYLKEKPNSIYYKNSDSFFYAHGVLDTIIKESAPHKVTSIKSTGEVKDLSYIYEDKDIQESKLNGALKDFKFKEIEKDTANHQLSTTEKDLEVLENQYPKEYLALGALALIGLGTLLWLLLRKRSVNNQT